MALVNTDNPTNYPLYAVRVPALIFGLLLVAWPFLWVFLVALAADPTSLGLSETVGTYVYLSWLAYPLIYGVSLFFSIWAYRRESSAGVVLALALIPLVSGYPWVLLLVFPFVGR